MSANDTTACIIKKTRQWRSAERICFRPHDKETSDYLQGLPDRQRSEKINRALSNLFKTFDINTVVPVYQRGKGKPFNNVVFQPTIANASILAKCKKPRGRPATIIRMALDLIPKK